MNFEYDVCVVGGCGHVGLPLAVAFAAAGLRVSAHDINDEAVAMVRSGRMPFRDAGMDELLPQVVNRNFEVRNDPELVAKARYVVVIIGTPVDEHLNPTFHAMRRTFMELMPHFRDGQCIVLRSTLFPGTTARIAELVREAGIEAHVAFCPERIAEGQALRELQELPQIISGASETALAMARELFSKIVVRIIELQPIEAELAKVFCNSWRYIQFATANQFFMIAADHGLDFYRIYDAVTADYPRLAGLPGSGFTAGPCLFKDTMQLAAAHDNHFYLGHAAMLVNEGLPNFVVRHLKETHRLHELTVGILGMAFKAESDDPRQSLSYKLRKILEYEAAGVLCTDEYIDDPRFLPLEDVVAQADLLIIGAPHRRYRTLEVPARTQVVDIWNLRGEGALLR